MARFWALQAEGAGEGELGCPPGGTWFNTRWTLPGTRVNGLFCGSGHRRMASCSRYFWTFSRTKETTEEKEGSLVGRILAINQVVVLIGATVRILIGGRSHPLSSRRVAESFLL